MKKKRLAFISLLIALITVFAVAFTACGGKSNAKISLNPTTLSVAVDSSATLTATANENPTWSVEDDSIAKISPLGKICSVKGLKEGSTKVIAKVGEDTAECTVTVTKNDTETVVIKNAAGEEITTLELNSGDSATLTAIASKGSAVTWTTSNPYIASVNNGVVTAGSLSGTAKITAKVTESIKAEVTVTVTGGAEYYNLEKTGADGAAAKKDTWTYYAESWVIIEEAYSTGNGATITFSNNDSDNPSFFYATQMFYCKSDLESGEYKLTFDADVDAATGGRVTLNGNIINLEKGKHSYTTYYNDTGKSIDLQFGVNGLGMEIKDATVTFSNLQWEKAGAHEKLAAPSFTYNASTKVITITDTNANGSVGSYTLYFYDSNNEVVGNTPVTNGGVVDLSTIPNGTHTAKLVANGANVHYEASDPSANGVQITVANDRTALSNGEEHDAYINPGAWYEWHDKGWNESTVTLGDAYIDLEGAVHFDIANISGSNKYNQAAHLYKHDSSFTPGSLYTVSMIINSSVACTIDVCDTMVDLAVGNNNVSVAFTHPVEHGAWNGLPIGATIRIYFNNVGNFVLSNVNVTAAQSTQLAAPSFSIGDGNVITITDSNDAANVGKYELGFFQSDELKTTVTVTSGNAVDLSKVAAGEYTVKLRAVGASALYTTSDWSSSSATLTSSNTNVPIVYSEEKESFTGWKYWDSKEAQDWNNWTEAKCTDCYMDSNEKVTMSFTCVPPQKDGAVWAMQMFYKHATEANGYNVSLMIKSSVDTTITVCGQQIELTANVEKPVSVPNYKSEKGSAIDIQFGLIGGTFEISIVSVAPVNA